uniref:DDE Tnp4 domain-containing protein n=1 Tax=Oryzias latipes TaxID=8090 RepID=A0A3P9HXL1_ORYLA
MAAVGMERDELLSMLLVFLDTVLQAQARLYTFWHNLMRERQQEDNLIPPAITLVPLPPPQTRSHWMKVRSKDWWEMVVLLEFSNDEWKQNFRMTRLSFMKLCALMESHMAPEDVTVRAPVPLIMRVAVVLYKLGSCAEYKVLANQFGISRSSVKTFFYMFCKGMSHHIPQIMGLIDGTHIPILPPSDGYKDFVNHKVWPSYILQAVVDDQFCCKMPGSAHDANGLRHSDLFQRAHLLPKVRKHLFFSFYTDLLIVGDPAYSLLDWLIKGYSNSPRLTPEQESFNPYLSSVRVGVEMTFGSLKSRWKVLLKRSHFLFTFMPTMIATCCALHNFFQKKRDHASSSLLKSPVKNECFVSAPPYFHPAPVTATWGMSARDVQYVRSSDHVRYVCT